MNRGHVADLIVIILTRNPICHDLSGQQTSYVIRVLRRDTGESAKRNRRIGKVVYVLEPGR